MKHRLYYDGLVQGRSWVIVRASCPACSFYLLRLKSDRPRANWLSELIGMTHGRKVPFRVFGIILSPTSRASILILMPAAALACPHHPKMKLFKRSSDSKPDSMGAKALKNPSQTAQISILFTFPNQLVLVIITPL